jgi:hypothetical protein
MSLVITDVAEGGMLTRILDPDMTLKLFKNNVIDGLTAAQIEALTAASFTEATFTGYASVSIAGTNQGVSSDWTVATGAPGTATAAEETFESTANQTAQTIYGYYVIKTTGGTLQWFEMFAEPQEIESDGDTIKVTPKFTLKDETD